MNSTESFKYKARGLLGRLLVLVAFLLFGGVAPVAAQEGAITGTVTDAQTGEPLDGAQVFVVGTEIGGLTGADGSYRITGVPTGQQRVRVQLIGYSRRTRNVEVSAGSASTVDFSVSPSAVSLQDVVVTAAGEEQVAEIGNALSRLNAAEEVDRSGSQTVANLMRGKTAGLTVQLNSGTVGAATSIKARGASSLSLSSRPLVYIDGARINTGTPGGGSGGKVLGQGYDRLNNLNPQNIESVEVVKGPAAATLYGTEAAGGVIRITTKGGGSGEPTFTFQTSYGQTWNDHEFENSVWNPRSFFGDAAKDTVYNLNLIERQNTFRRGGQTDAHASVRGGTDGVSYYGAGSYEYRQGVTFTNHIEQMTGRGNFSVTPSEDLTIQFSNQFTHDVTSLPRADNAVEGWVAHSQLSSPWVMRLRRADPNTGGEPIETCAQNFEQSRVTGQPLSELGTQGCPESPAFAATTLEDLKTVVDDKTTDRYVGSLTARYQPIDIVSLRATLGYDAFTDRIRTQFPRDPSQPFGSKSLGLIVRDHRTGANLTAEVSGGLQVTVTDNLSSDTRVGVQYFREHMVGSQTEGRDFPTGAPSVINSVQTTAQDRYFDERTIGFFVQERIGWKDRIFITPAVRFDDNSAFGEELGIQTYPRVSGSWVLGEEEWTPDFFQQLKLRGAWGLSGKQPGTNSALSLLRPIPVSRPGGSGLGVTANQPGNPQLQPEVGEELEVGFDMTALEGNWNASFTFYSQRTENVLVRRPLAPTEGYRAAKWENIAELKNVGVELDTDYQILESQDLGWNLGITLSSNDGEITKLPTPFSAETGRFEEGQPFAFYYAREVSMEGGEAVVADERSYQGKPLPTYSGSINTNVTLFDNLIRLYAVANYQTGQSLYSAYEDFRCQWIGGGRHGGICAAMEERNSDGSLTDEALIKSAATDADSHAPFVYKSDFLRLRTVSATLNLPSNIAGFVGATSGNIRLTGSNLLTVTNYPQIDPEANQNATEEEAGRTEFFSLPVVPTASASISLTF